MKAETVIRFESILCDFYSVAAQQHPQLQQKSKVLADFLAKVSYQGEDRGKGVQSQVEDNLETLTSIGELDSPRQMVKAAPVFGSSMFFTFLFSANPELVHSSSADRVVTPHNFVSKSIENLTLYGLLVNHLHIQQSDARQRQHLSQVRTPFVQSYHLLRVVKRAMVGAARGRRSLAGQKGYAKIRYLYEELMRRVEGGAVNQEKYIRLILEEFDGCYISQVFVELRKDSHSGRYLRGDGDCRSPRVRECLEESTDFGFSYEDFGAVLERLGIKMTVVDSWQSREMGRAEGNLRIVAMQQRDGSFKLKEIVTLSEGAE